MFRERNSDEKKDSHRREEPPHVMELPPFLRHHTRYVPLPHPSPPPPPPPNFSDDRRFYPNYHTPHPSTPPIAPPQSYRPFPPALAPPPPPPPPYNPHQSQFTFLNQHYSRHPIDDDPRRRRPFEFTHRHPSPPPRVSTRTLFDDDRPCLRIPELGASYKDSRPDSWADPPRFPVEDRLVRPIPFDFDQELHHHRPFDSHIPLSPYRPSDIYGRDVEGGPRFIDDFSDGFKHNHTEKSFRARSDSRCGDDDNNYLRGCDRYIPSSCGSSRNLALGDSHVSNSKQSRDFDVNLGNYKPCYPSVPDSERFWTMKDENQRWVHAQPPLRELANSQMEMEGNDFVSGDGNRVVSGRWLPHDVGKFNSKGSWEETQDTARSPRKKIQKKSALLRIQLAKPNNRNRNEDQIYSSPYVDDSDHSTLKGKAPIYNSDRRMKEDREESPVELDVSFKSNALVAKAIVAPSSHVAISERNLTPRSRKIRKVSVPEMNVSESPLTKLNKGPVGLDSPAHVSVCPSSTHRDSKLSEEKIANSDSSALCDTGSHPCSHGVSDLPEINTMKRSVTDMCGNNVGSDGTCLLGVQKKKVTSILSRASSSRLKKKNDEPVYAESSINGSSLASFPDEGEMHSEEKFSSAGMMTVGNITLQSSSNDVTASFETNKADESIQALVSERDDDIDSGRRFTPNTKRRRSSSDPILVSSSFREQRTDKGNLNADGSVQDLHTKTNSDQDLTELQNMGTFCDVGLVGDVNQQAVQNQIPVTSKDGLMKGSLESMHSVEGNLNANMLSFKVSEIYKDSISKCDCVCDMHNDLSSANELIKQDKVTVSGVDAICRPPLYNQVAVSLENDTMEGFSKSIPSVGGNGMVGSSSKDNTKIHEGSINTHDNNHDAVATSSCKSTLPNSQGMITFSDGGYTDTKRQSCPDEAAILLEDGSMEGPVAKISLGGNLNVGSVEEHTPKITRKRKVRSRLCLSGQGTGDKPVNGVGLAPSDSPLSCAVKDIVFAEEAKGSGDGSSDIGQSCTDNSSFLYGNDITEVSSVVEVSVRNGVDVGANGTSLNCKKKRKVFAPSLSSTLSHIQEVHVSSGPCTSSVGMLLNSHKGLTQSENKVAQSGINTMCSAGLPPCSKPITILLENGKAGGSSEARNLLGDGFTGNGSKLEQDSPCPPGLENKQKENATLVMAISDHHNDIIDMKSSRRKIIVASAIKEHHMPHMEPTQDAIPLETKDLGCNSYLLVKDVLPSVSNTLSLCVSGDVVASTTNSSDEPVESVPDTLSCVGSPETLPIISSLNMMDAKLSLGQGSNEMVSVVDKKQEEKPVSEGVSLSVSLNTSSQNTKINKKSGYAALIDHSKNATATPLLSQYAIKTTQNLSTISGEANARKNELKSAVSVAFPRHSNINFTTLDKTAHSSHRSKPRTWHRSSNSSTSTLPGKNSYSSYVPPQRNSPKKVGKVQNTSYIRKGNSLIRKPPLVAALPYGSHVLSSSVLRLKPSGNGETKKSASFQSKVDVIDPSSGLRTGEQTLALETPKTPPLSCTAKLSDCTWDYTALPLADPQQNGCLQTISDPLKWTENKDVLKPSEDAPKSSEIPETQTSLADNLDNKNVRAEGNSNSVKMKKIIYVKRKSNQLVVASNSSNLFVQDVNKTQVSASDGYYKRKKNQLIRKSLESHIMPRVDTADESLDLEGRRAPKVRALRGSSKKRSAKGLAKTYKPSKLSLVWTLCDSQSAKEDHSLQCRKIWPQLFPWKRARYWRNFVHNSAFISDNSSQSTVSRRLLLSRKRDTIYTRSMRGFSLRRSKVLSVGGSSLKWSKSIERNSKKANEEATLAVVAADKKKREQNGAAHVIAGTKNRNHSSRERIFRVGSVRYKMDRSRRTLQRISDKELSCADASQSGKIAKKYYVPRRLLIGNDEYVRIGNGNQLIRDPKRRTRILASEKVRWSLHTARLRLARKRQYCQFFTRFGKCNKDDGKCPYIHDPSKIAVCTKFLNGSCSNPSCKLTHKVIPERMQDCSYFIEGLCSNESCPYRHVNVNPKASVCEGFLRGYCADGNECRKKHTYVCPVFDATGICPQGSKCKLHHPKKRNMGKKRKLLREHKNGIGRYFGSRHIEIGECRTAVSEKTSLKDDDDIFCQEGTFLDYISLDVNNEEVEEANDPTCDQTTLYQGETVDIQVANLDELIKPIRIMTKLFSATDSASEKTASYASEESNLL